MPTFEQIKELNDECTWKWTFKIGVKGIKKGVKVTGPNGNSIFLPASGYRYYGNGSLRDVGSFGYYWSASFSSNYDYRLYFIPSSYYRDYGLPVRAVKG